MTRIPPRLVAATAAAFLVAVSPLAAAAAASKAAQPERVMELATGGS